MAKRRSKRLNGLPREHAEAAGDAGWRADEFARDALAEAKSGDCSAAFGSLVRALNYSGQVKAHVDASGGRAPGMAGDLNAALSAFRAGCLRKPGLLDRFRRKKG